MKIKNVKNGIRYEKNGWTYISIKGNAKERGYAHGCLVKDDMKEIMKMLEFDLMYSYGYSCSFFSEIISEIYTPQIKANFPELYEEMEGIAKGAEQSVNDIILWNCYVSIDSFIGSIGMLIKDNATLSEKYGNLQLSATPAQHGEGGGQKDRCTGFIAVGSYTKGGKIVCGHNSFDNFIDGQYANAVIDINPTNGARIIMQSAPGWIYSGTDFYVTSTGFICTETTIGGFNAFELKDPICCRIRQAMQYASSLEDCVKILKKNNGGDYANSWLLGDINTNTIMRIELGLKYVKVSTKKDGYFIGYNAPEDPEIRNLECSNTGYADIRRHQGARRVRLTQLMEEHKGKIDITIAQDILADHYDVYLNKINPCSRTCCGHYELDDRAFMSDPSRPKPYQPRGALDGMVCDSVLAKSMRLIGRWGSSCGLPFDKTEFCKKHIQWRDQEPYLKDRPSQPWTEFTIHGKKIGMTKKNKNKNKKEKEKKDKIKIHKSTIKIHY